MYELVYAMNIDERIEAFFDGFSNDFSTFDGRLIAQRYHVPFVPVSADGSTQLLRDEAQVGQYFQSFLDDYRRQGVTACHYEDLASNKIGACAYSAVTTWLLTDEVGDLKVSWRESYNLLDRNSRLLVYTSADFS